MTGRAGNGRVGLARVLGACALVAVLAPSSTTAATNVAPHADLENRPLAQRPDEVRDYWTAARRRAAEPAGLVIGPKGRSHGLPGGVVAPRAATDASGANTAYPDRTHGKVFFTISGGSDPGDFFCSGTVVQAPAHSLVWTAGHCVNDAEFGGGFATNWMFVPGYRAGERPFGTWIARELHTTDGWSENANIRLDLGAASVRRDGQGRGIEDVVGAQAIAFGQSRDQTFTAFGYPAEATLFRPDFDGSRLYACVSPRTADDAPPGSGPPTMQLGCDMTAGASGGGWVTPEGTVNGVISYGYPDDFNHLYGPYFGILAERLHADAGGHAVLCGERPVTNRGTRDQDRFTGGPRDDSMVLGGGRDSARGAVGADELCGGKAGDGLRGNGGRDTLRGGDGADLLVGGPGRDVCIGGPGRDRARRCEEERAIP